MLNLSIGTYRKLKIPELWVPCEALKYSRINYLIQNKHNADSENRPYAERIDIASVFKLIKKSRLRIPYNWEFYLRKKLSSNCLDELHHAVNGSFSLFLKKTSFCYGGKSLTYFVFASIVW